MDFRSPCRRVLMRPARLNRPAIVLKPSTLLNLHQALRNRKYRLLFSLKRRGKPGPKGPSKELLKAVVRMKNHNPSRAVRESRCRSLWHSTSRSIRTLFGAFSPPTIDPNWTLAARPSGKPQSEANEQNRRATESSPLLLVVDQRVLTSWPFAFFPVWVEVRVFPSLDTTLRVVITSFPSFFATVSMVFALIRFNTIVSASGKPVTR